MTPPLRCRTRRAAAWARPRPSGQGCLRLRGVLYRSSQPGARPKGPKPPPFAGKLIHATHVATGNGKPYSFPACRGDDTRWSEQPRWTPRCSAEQILTEINGAGSERIVGTGRERSVRGRRQVAPLLVRRQPERLLQQGAPATFTCWRRSPRAFELQLVRVGAACSSVTPHRATCLPSRRRPWHCERILVRCTSLS